MHRLGRARQFKQLYVMYDNNLEKAWRNLLVIAADTYAATHNGDQPILLIEGPKESKSKQEGSSNSQSNDSGRHSRDKNRGKRRRDERNEKEEEG